jgi:hypothetical protein
VQEKIFALMKMEKPADRLSIHALLVKVGASEVVCNLLIIVSYVAGQSSF